VLALADNRAIGGSVSDYFADSNAGVVEFILTAPEHRGSGLGTALLRDTEGRLVADAQRRGRDLGFIAAEINDPFRRSATPDNVDPFERAGWWDRRGYGKLDFPYVQPALSPEQVPVRNLMLGVKLFAPSQRRAISAPAVDVFLRDYLIHAMRIADPASSAEYVEMSRWLGSRDDVGVISLRKYIGEDPSAGANIHEVTGPDDQRLPGALAVYKASFHDPATMLPSRGFRTLLVRRQRRLPFAYHLWALEKPPTMAVAGIASFFTLATAGFGGYVALVAPLRGAGVLPAVLARIERQLIADSADVRGWYIECADEHTLGLFCAQGFFEVAVPYRQPPLGLAAARAAPVTPLLHLLYKEFGAQYAPPMLTPADFIAAMRDVFSDVYDVARPEADPTYGELAARARAWPAVPFVSRA